MRMMRERERERERKVEKTPRRRRKSMSHNDDALVEGKRKKGKVYYKISEAQKR